MINTELKSILIVDDYEPIRSSLTEFLELNDYNVSSVDSGENALQFIKEKTVDLFLLDINMAGMSGLELLEKLKLFENNYTSIIITSLDHDMENVNKAIELGAFSYIYKPVDYEQLTKHIEKALEFSCMKKKRSKYINSLEERASESTNELRDIIGSLRNTQKRFETLLNCMDEALIALDSSNCIMAINSNFAKILNKLPHDCLFKNIDEIIENDFLKEQLLKILYEHNNGISQSLPFLTVPYEYDQQNNSDHFFTYNTSKLTNEEEEIIGSIITLSDQTDRIKVEKMRRSILNNFVHELRTPLTSLISLTEALRSTDINNEQKKYLEIISECEDKLMVQINRTLDFSKLEKNNSQLVDDKIFVFDICKACIDILEPEVKKKGLSISFSFPDKLNVPVLGDKEKLKEILINLISNAIKFTQKGNIHVNGYSRNQEDNNIFFKIEVIDTGIGIKDSEKELIFKEFIQLDDEADRKYDGTGLGLAITKKLVELMKGTISVSDNPGGGSIFTITILLKKQT